MERKILITGASGLIGKKLTELLLLNNYEVVHLGRSKKQGKVASFIWDIEKKMIDPNAFEKVDTIIHLAGANVGEKRWTEKRKKEILDSRIQSTFLLKEFLQKKAHSVKTFISASAIGYYGFEGDRIFQEDDKPGNDFLARVTKGWEDAVDEINMLGIRVVKIRIGIVLSKEGGALKEIAKPISFGVGSPIGSGQQYLSWIHIHDLCLIFVKAIEDEKMNGAYNAASSWINNKDLTQLIAKILRKPLWMPNVPSFALKFILGEMAQIVMNGSKVSSKKISQTGFKFQFNEIENALRNLLAD
ncbi:MAG TPA: TIGR01777 family protein [Cytophagales bacterium]|jgi:uncharacterized protein|nr:TIGR01777 family protein [Cytophagales bacterium]